MANKDVRKIPIFRKALTITEKNKNSNIPNISKIEKETINSNKILKNNQPQDTMNNLHGYYKSNIKSSNNEIIKINGKKLPYNAEDNSVYDLVRDSEKLIQRRYYDNHGKPNLDIDNTDHGNPKTHNIVPHAHDWRDNKRDTTFRDLTDGEKLKNIDLYGGTDE